MSQETLSVSRATAITALRSLVSDLRTLANGAAIDRTNSAVADLKLSLDAPVSFVGELEASVVNDQLPEVKNLLPLPAVRPPADCRQRLASEGKAYPRSSCAVCGAFSPDWRECDSMLATAHVTRLQAENAALQQRLNVADQRNDELTAVLNQVWDQAGVLPGRLARLIAGVV